MLYRIATIGLVCLLTMGMECGGDEEGGEDAGTAGTGGDQAGTGGDQAGTGGTTGGMLDCSTMCSGGGCPYDTVDCAAACANLDTICNEDACSDDCDGMLTAGNCNLACMTAQFSICTNVYFGCAAENNTCASSSQCLMDKGLL